MKPSALASVVILLTGTILTAGCATAPRHPALESARLPALIPLQELFVNTAVRNSYKVSPDGKQLAWLAVAHYRLAIHVQTLGQTTVRVISSPLRHNVAGFVWSQDSRRLIYWHDQPGDDRAHLYLADGNAPEKRSLDLTPIGTAKAHLHRILRHDPVHILVIHNRRDKRLFDLYRINLNSGRQTLMAQNPGFVTAWITDDKGHLRGRTGLSSRGKRFLQVLTGTPPAWRRSFSWDMEATLHFLAFTPDDRHMWLLSNRHRDRIGLVKLNPATGQEVLIYEDPEVDLSEVIISGQTRQPLVAISEPGYQRLHFFDARAQADAALFNDPSPRGLRLVSADDAQRLVTLTVYSDKSADHYVLDRQTRRKKLLSRHPISAYAHALSSMEPVKFKSRDGLNLNGYLTMPQGAQNQRLPMVLLVHGGPWQRDVWGYNEVVQFLANRGYAVLQVNFRGSSGYGRAFKTAAVGEFAGKMHTDLIDAVHWAVERGLADPDKIAIYGYSYGGYAALVGLTFTPEIFACGIDAFGVSNLVSFARAVPPEWQIHMPLWYKYMGNPDIPAERRMMEARSPLFHVEQIQRPLLVAQGGRDQRVRQQESDQLVTAMRRNGKAVEYMLFENEGHGFRNWKNRLLFYRKVEDFLAEHLGGRSAGPVVY